MINYTDVQHNPSFPIGIFDSGVGGLSVLKALQVINPGFPVFYFADQLHVPYGPRSIDQIREFSFAISEFLINQGVKVIVVACNTASAAALHPLRKMFPDTQFVGMEPAVKPAAQTTKSGVVGVLATPATFQGTLYASVVERFAKEVIIYQNTCPGLVQEIEAGNLNGTTTNKILNDALMPMLNNGIDTIVLGCTHYPFVIPTIQAIAGESIRIIDPSPAVAKQAIKISVNIREQSKKSSPSDSGTTLITSGNLIKFKQTIEAFQIPYTNILQANWNKNTLELNITQH